MPHQPPSSTIDAATGREILKLYKEHQRVEPVAEKVGFSVYRVRDYLERKLGSNFSPHLGKFPMPPAEVERLKAIALVSSSWADYAKRAERKVSHPVNDRRFGVRLGCVVCHKRPRARRLQGRCRVCWELPNGGVPTPAPEAA